MKIQATVTLVLCFFFSLCLFFVLLTSQTSITAPTFLSTEAFFLLRKSIDFKCCWSRSSPSFSPTESSRGGSGVRSAWMTSIPRQEGTTPYLQFLEIASVQHVQYSYFGFQRPFIHKINVKSPRAKNYRARIYSFSSLCYLNPGLRPSAVPFKIDGVVLQPEVTGGYAHICSL